MCFQKGRWMRACVCLSMCAVQACIHTCARARSGSLPSCVSVFVWCVSSLTGLEGEMLNFPADSISLVIGWEKARLHCLLKECGPLKAGWVQREEKWSRIGYEPATVVMALVFVALVMPWPNRCCYNEREKVVKLLHLLAGVAWIWLHYE